MNKIKQFFEANDLYAKHSGIDIVDVKEGYAKVKMLIQEFHLNGAKTVHGGAIFTLADFAFAIASNSHGTLSLAINVSISFLKAATNGVLFAEAREVSLNPKLATYLVTVTDDKNNTIALFQGMVYRKSEKLFQK